MTDSPIGDAEGRLRSIVRGESISQIYGFDAHYYADYGSLAIDLKAILARLETAEQTAADGWAAGYRAGGEDAKSMIRTLNGANAELEARLETAERENKRLTKLVDNSREDEYRDALSDLVSLDGEAWAIGGGPGFKERHAKAWDAARELVRNEP